MNISVLLITLSLSHPRYNLQNDYCQLADIAGFSEAWLSDDPVYDFNADGIVNLQDFVLLRDFWLIRTALLKIQDRYGYDRLLWFRKQLRKNRYRQKLYKKLISRTLLP